MAIQYVGQNRVMRFRIFLNKSIKIWKAKKQITFVLILVNSQFTPWNMNFSEKFLYI